MPQLRHLPCFACITGGKHSINNPCRRASGKKCHQCAESDAECADTPALFFDRLVAPQSYQKNFEGCSEFLKSWAKDEFNKHIKPLGVDARSWLAEENSRIEAEREEERRKQDADEQRRLFLEAFDNGQQAVAGPGRANINSDDNSSVVTALGGFREEIKGWRMDLKEELQSYKKQRAEDRKTMLEFTKGLKENVEKMVQAALYGVGAPTETPEKGTPMSTPRKDTPTKGIKEKDIVDVDTIEEEEEAESKRCKTQAEDDKDSAEHEEQEEEADN
ncbi:hypothetical protein KEM55_003366 [Ascosphaera atra]|nr:hypothetical protein KEM55_003366 [Ascosphaera atra]